MSRGPRWWRRLGPQLVGRATPFRLYQDPRTVAYFPATIRQLIGGRHWSIALIRTQPPRREDQP